MSVGSAKSRCPLSWSMLYPTPLPRGTTPPAPHHTPPAHPPAQTPHEPSDGQCWTGASPGWGRGGVPGLAPPLYSGLPNEVRPWKAFFPHGWSGCGVGGLGGNMLTKWASRSRFMEFKVPWWSWVLRPCRTLLTRMASGKGS